MKTHLARTMPKKCIICKADAKYAIKGTSDYYCEECAEENFADISLLEKVDEARKLAAEDSEEAPDEEEGEDADDDDEGKDDEDKDDDDKDDDSDFDDDEEPGSEEE